MKKIVLILIFLTITSIITPVSAQQFSIEKLKTLAAQTLEITIDESGKVHVIHNVKKDNEVKEVPIIAKSFSNLVVIDDKGNEPQHALVTDEFASIHVFPTKENYVVEYDLEDVINFKNGLWRWDFLYVASTTFIFPENVDLVFANNMPVKMDERRGMVCHGCNVKLEYVIDEPVYVKNVQWEEKTFQVGFRTLTEITSFNFDQPRKSISFDINEKNQLITLFIPLELLWNPYDVYLNDNNILKHEFFNNGTHVWLNIRPGDIGQITIIGTSVVPEFPILIPLFLGIAGVVILHQRIRLSLR